jgi:hypothetical protein
MRLSGHRLALALFAGVVAVWLIGMAVVIRHAALPAEASGPMLAVFEPGLQEEEMFARLARAEARIVKQSGLPFIWVVAGDEPGLAGRLRAEGALGAYRELPVSPVIAGCFALADAKVAGLTP